MCLCVLRCGLLWQSKRRMNVMSVLHDVGVWVESNCSFFCTLHPVTPLAPVAAAPTPAATSASAADVHLHHSGPLLPSPVSRPGLHVLDPCPPPAIR